jgi:hypothetical protein
MEALTVFIAFRGLPNVSDEDGQRGNEDKSPDKKEHFHAYMKHLFNKAVK